jgi:hypothetical protein
MINSWQNHEIIVVADLLRRSRWKMGVIARWRYREARWERSNPGI